MSDIPIPDEVLREILTRLPVTPLLRFRCVCKSWKALIDSDQFIKDHLNHSRKSDSNINIIFNLGYLYSAEFDDLLTNRGTFLDLFHPLKDVDFDTDILGSCDGLLVLSNSEETILLNTSTRRFHTIPFTDMECTGYYSAMQWVNCGFGYDVVTDDYKFIRIVQHYGIGGEVPESIVKVYSLKSNSWRWISDFPYFHGIRRDTGEFTNGALHWVVSATYILDGPRHSVAAFDLGTEDYSLVSLPEFAGDEFYMDVRVLGGLLGLVCDYNKDHVDIWVMKEYGLQESWLILFRLTQWDVCKQFDSGNEQFDIVMPTTYSDCNRKVLVRFDGYLMWYDLDEESIDLPMLQIAPCKALFVVHTCLKSLVRLNRKYDFDVISSFELLSDPAA